MADAAARLLQTRWRAKQAARSRMRKMKLASKLAKAAALIPKSSSVVEPSSVARPSSPILEPSSVAPASSPILGRSDSRPGFDWLEGQIMNETSEEFQVKVQTLKQAAADTRRTLSKQKRAESFLRALPPGLPPVASPPQLQPVQEIFDVSVSTVELEWPNQPQRPRVVSRAGSPQRRVVSRL